MRMLSGKSKTYTGYNAYIVHELPLFSVVSYFINYMLVIVISYLFLCFEFALNSNNKEAFSLLIYKSLLTLKLVN
jgi:hypothetical protein